jgi:secreted PhoX family phosphatase
MATDANNDGVAEKIDLFASLGPFGSEPTGLIFDPRTGGFLVSIQHPSSNNDAVWSVAAAPVPVPGAVWLFGSAIAGLGAMRRKRR